jgi:hypothetical protein
VDRTALERLLEQVAVEKTAAQHQLVALQERVNALTKTAEGLQALLDLTPEPAELVFKTDSDTAHAVEAAHVAEEAQHVKPAVAVPSGTQAARLILQTDPTRFWTVSEVWDEEIRRGWAQPLETTKRNAPARIALVRLKERYPDSVEKITAPVLAYRWSPKSSPSQNGSGASHSEVSG